MAAHNNSLFQEILANPHDDDVRLVYSDWLEEQGETERAEFIRLQIQWVNALPRDRRRPQWLPRITELKEKFSEEWRPPELTGVLWGDFQRGWVDSLTPTHWEAFVSQAERIFSLTPVVKIDLCFNLNGSAGAQTVAKSPWLRQLNSLNMNYNRIGDGGAVDVAFSPHLENLFELSLNGNLIGSEGAKDLALSPQLDNLAELRLFDNLIGDTGAMSLVESRHLQNLELLDLRANPISKPAREMLHKRYGNRVLV